MSWLQRGAGAWTCVGMAMLLFYTSQIIAGSCGARRKNKDHTPRSVPFLPPSLHQGWAAGISPADPILCCCHSPPSHSSEMWLQDVVLKSGEHSFGMWLWRSVRAMQNWAQWSGPKQQQNWAWTKPGAVEQWCSTTQTISLPGFCLALFSSHYFPLSWARGRGEPAAGTAHHFVFLPAATWN